jgi:type I restriction enzyme, S subunit
MTAFHQVRVGDVLTLQRGFDITKSEQSDGDVPIVSSSGISSYHNKWKVKGPGVVIGRKGTLGTVHFISSNYWPHDTTLWVKDFKGNDPRFLSYFLQTLKLENFDVGASNPTLNRNHVHKIRVIFPKQVDTQKRITAILSAYDELIESNNRRIALLEKLAEEIYREWFVRLRFPGHEKTNVVKGVPHDWERKGLSGLGTYLNGYAFEPNDWGLEGKPIIKIKEMTSGVTADTPRNSGDDVPAKYHFDDGTVIFSWSATLLVVIWDQGSGLLNQHLFKVDPAPDVPKSFLYFSIKFSIPIFESLTTGATMQHIKRKELSFVKVNVPPPELRQQFDKLVSPILEQKISLTTANRKLIQTRDGLLPRLISGKLSVEKLDIQFPPGMAEELNAEATATAHA